MNRKEHIVFDPDVLVGKPVIKGTRLSVELLLDRLADGWSVDDLLTSYPQLTYEEVQELAAVTESLSAKDLQRLLAWLQEKNWENWDAQLEQDITAGRLDFLIEEALSEKKKHPLKEQ